MSELKELKRKHLVRLLQANLDQKDAEILELKAFARQHTQQIALLRQQVDVLNSRVR